LEKRCKHRLIRDSVSLSLSVSKKWTYFKAFDPDLDSDQGSVPTAKLATIVLYFIRDSVSESQSKEKCSLSTTNPDTEGQ
jgi:hypothetical protein